MYYKYFLLFIFAGVGRCYDMLRIRNTSYGYANGISFKSSDCGTDYYAFYGVPYGELGNKRFEDASPPSKWDRIRNFTYYGPSCSWKGGINSTNRSLISQECLNLNIFTTKYCLLYGNCPVLLTFYGGETNFNETNLFNTGYTLKDFINSSDDNIVFVIGDHREGIIGNLNLNSRFPNISINTNVALFDIQRALGWIKDEIKSFGGKGNDITLMGVGDSAIEVNMLHYLEDSRILFNRLILIPLSSVDNWIHQDNSEDFSRRIAVMAGCANNYTDWDSFLQLEGIAGCMKFVNEIRLSEYENILTSSGFRKPLPFLDRGPNSFFKFSDNQATIERKNVPVLVVGNIVEDKNISSSSTCKFFVNFFQYDNNSLAYTLTNTTTDSTDINIIDENLELYLGSKNECLANFNSISGSYIYQFNFQSLYSSFSKFPLLTNKSMYDIEGIFTVDRNENIQMPDVIEKMFEDALVNFINTNSFGDERDIIYNFNINLENIVIIRGDDNILIDPEIKNQTLDDQIKALINNFMSIVKKYLYGEQYDEELLPFYQYGELKKLVNVTVLFPPDIHINSTTIDSYPKIASTSKLNLGILLFIIVLYQIFFITIM
uniref:COesterase domain-containing protein n=1 Tax=Strongyloides venezuelensis TaxID=75913 RepID=A0A0K0EW00_STRVS